MERLSWYLKRLSVMEPGEIRHRIGERWHLGRLAAGQRADGHAAVATPGDWRAYAFCTASESALPALSWDEDGLEAAARGARQGAWPALGFDWTWRADDPDVWRRAPDTGRLWPMDFFGAIPYRAGNPHGDSRVVWEPARLQQLVALAWLAQRGGEGADETAALAVAQLHSWVAANPPYRGVHYVSVMECALRLIAACHALDLLRARLPEPEATWPALLAIVASHAPLIARRLSLFSSSGNHTIAEAVGLLYAGVLFGEFPQAARWRATGLDLLAREAARQVLPDGGGIERAFHYHRFVMDLLALADGLLARRGETVPDAVTAALDRGRRFLAAVTLPDGETLPVGDGDGGYALSRFVRLHAPLMAGDEPVAHFPETGYSVLRAEGGRATLALFDHGALGMAPSYGHAHADALSFVLYRDGEPMLIDPGTFTYTGDPVWRRYFRSTAAHNTLRIDGADQTAQETAFQWSAPRPCRLLNADVSPQGVVRMLGLLRRRRRHGIPAPAGRRLLPRRMDLHLGPRPRRRDAADRAALALRRHGAADGAVADLRARRADGQRAAADPGGGGAGTGAARRHIAAARLAVAALWAEGALHRHPPRGAAARARDLRHDHHAERTRPGQHGDGRNDRPLAEMGA